MNTETFLYLNERLKPRNFAVPAEPRFVILSLILFLDVTFMQVIPFHFIRGPFFYFWNPGFRQEGVL